MPLDEGRWMLLPVCEEIKVIAYQRLVPIWKSTQGPGEHGDARVHANETAGLFMHLDVVVTSEERDGGCHSYDSSKL